MADEITPTTPAPAATPEPASSVPSGIDAAMKQFDAQVERLDKADAAPKSVPEPKSEATPAPEAKTAPEAKPATPEPDVEPAWDKAPKNLRNAHFKKTRELEGKVSSYEQKIKELESKPVQSAADLKKISDYEARIKDMETRLEEREQRILQSDYSRSEEFDRLYVKKGQRAYEKAIADVKGLSVKYVDQKTQEEADRPATQRDFDYLRALPAADRNKKIAEMFGESASDVRDHIRELNKIEQDGNEAIENARTKAEETRKLNEKQHGERSLEYSSHAERAAADAIKNHAQYFAPDAANPEASAALEKGLAYVDSVAKNSSTMSPREAAESATMVRLLAGAAPRLMTEKKQLLAKVEGLEGELAKYRKSAPGVGTQGGAPAAPKEAKGIKDLAAAFDD